MAEIEWEFNEGSDRPDGQFMATGKVISLLRGHLGRGEVDQAVSLYESCSQNVGDQVWAEFEGASVQMKKAIANLFYRARDYKRSALACEKLGEWVAAGRSHEAAYDLGRAAQCYMKGNDKTRAAAVLEKGGDHRRAAEIYFEAGDVDAAASALERAGDPVGAAQIQIRKQDFKRAAQILAQVQLNDPNFVHAVGLLSEVLVKLDRRDLAIQRLASAVPRGAPIRDKLIAELAYRLGRLMWEVNQFEQARQAFELVRAFNPQFKDVAECLDAIARGGQKSAPASDPFAAAGAPAMPQRPAPSGVTVTPVHTPPELRAVAPPMPPPASRTRDTIPMLPPRSGTDPFAALDGNPFAPKKDGSPPSAPNVSSPPPAATVPHGLVTRMEGYDVLKKLPIFQDLSLDEMKAFYNICEQIFYPKGEIVIEQGRKGEALIIVLQGTLRVSKVEANRETTLATLAAGNSVGEMSLIDEGPTSARVTAAEPVKALRIRRDRFEQFLFANDRIALRVYRTFARTMSARLRDTNAQMSAKR